MKMTERLQTVAAALDLLAKEIGQRKTGDDKSKYEVSAYQRNKSGGFHWVIKFPDGSKKESQGAFYGENAGEDAVAAAHKYMKKMSDEYEALASKKLAATNAKVSTFITILSSLLTQYDAKQKHYNPYRLGLLLGALHKVEEKVKGLKDEDSPEALDTLVSALHDHFNVDAMPPTKKLVKMIDEWKSSKKLPKLPTYKYPAKKAPAEEKSAPEKAEQKPEYFK